MCLEASNHSISINTSLVTVNNDEPYLSVESQTNTNTNTNTNTKTAPMNRLSKLNFTTNTSSTYVCNGFSPLNFVTLPSNSIPSIIISVATPLPTVDI